jgi:hypothetical protein
MALKTVAFVAVAFIAVAFWLSSPQGSAVVFCLSNNSGGTTKVAF